jgi:small GTP-binding protein
LTNLRELYLSNNQLSQLPPEIAQLTNLSQLYLIGNNLSQLPPEIVQLTNLSQLDLSGNPLTSPPLELAKQGLKAIQQYFASLDEESRILNEVKVLLVGEGGAGKTSLVKRLLGQAFDRHEPATHGIRIEGWPVTVGDKSLKVNLWDFGGQEIMHATHQFFLSKRSLYVLVLDGRRDERPEYWLQHIASFGGDSPVLVVLNKYDQHPGYDVNRPQLRRKYPAIQDFFRVSCASGLGLAEFSLGLKEMLAQVKLLETRWPNSWFALKTQLEDLAEPYISYEQYESLCTTAGITEPISQEVLVDFLHDLGVVLRFKEFAWSIPTSSTRAGSRPPSTASSTRSRWPGSTAFCGCGT